MLKLPKLKSGCSWVVHEKIVCTISTQKTRRPRWTAYASLFTPETQAELDAWYRRTHLRDYNPSLLPHDMQPAHFRSMPPWGALPDEK